jgi:predicted permease
MRMEDNRLSGMPPEQARRDALVRFGSAARVKEDVTAADSAVLFDGLWRDVRYAARQLSRSPGFACIAVTTVALAIAANVVVFGVLNALILRPLDVGGRRTIFNVVQKPRGYDNQSWPDYLDYAARNTTFAGMAAYRIRDVGVRTGAAAFKSWDYEVSGNYFDVLGVRPALGRFFHASDEHGANSAPYVVLSDAFWRAHFGGNAHAIGAMVYLNKQPLTVIGVAPKDFHGTEQFMWPDFWLPMINQQQVDGYNSLDKRFNHSIWIIGILQPGISLAQATENLNAIAGQLAKQYPASNDGMGARLIKAGLMGEELGIAARAFLTGIMLLAILVLLAACANLANIFAARASDRTRELGIRMAIGSSRWHVIRQLLTEAVVVSLGGGALGTVFAFGLLRALTHWQPFAELPIHVSVLPDAGVFGIAVLLSAISGALPGLIPARQVWRMDALEAMRGSMASGPLFRRMSVRDVLLGIQVALCALLLTASLVALRGMQRSLVAPLGFQPKGALLARSDMHMAGYTDDASLRMQKRMLEEAARIAGVDAAGTINEPPLGTGGSSTPVYWEGTTDFRGSNSAQTAKFYSISPGYLRAAETHLLAGRDFTWHDDGKAPKVALVNERFARRMFWGRLRYWTAFCDGRGIPVPDRRCRGRREIRFVDGSAAAGHVFPDRADAG